MTTGSMKRWWLLGVTHLACNLVGTCVGWQQRAKLAPFGSDLKIAHSFLRVELAYEAEDMVMAESALLQHWGILQSSLRHPLTFVDWRERMLCLAMRATVTSPTTAAEERKRLVAQVNTECRASKQMGCDAQSWLTYLRKRYPKSPWTKADLGSAIPNGGSLNSGGVPTREAAE